MKSINETMVDLNDYLDQFDEEPNKKKTIE